MTVELGEAASGVDEDADEDEASTTVMKQTMAIRKAGGTTTLADTDAAADGGRTGIDHNISTPGLDETGASSGVSGGSTCITAHHNGSHIMMITNGGDGGGSSNRGGGSCTDASTPTASVLSSTVIPTSWIRESSLSVPSGRASKTERGRR